MMRVRRGHSLTELLVAISMCTVIMSMTTVLLQRVMHAQLSSRKCLDVERTVFRLGNTFRDDVHAAAKVTVENPKVDNGLLLRLSSNSDEIIEYRTIGKTLERRSILKDKTVSRDTFAFPAGTRFLVARDAIDIVTLTASPPEWSKDRSPRIAATAYAQVSARLGRDAPQPSGENRKERIP